MLKIAARRSVLLLALAAAALPALAQKKSAADPLANWPTHALRIVVGFPPGSTPDLVARTIADPLGKALGQTVIVDNRVGAGGNIGADIVAKANDNHTIGVMINGNLTIAKMLNPAINYDPQKDFQPISLIGTAPLLLAAPATANFQSAQEFFLAAHLAGGLRVLALELLPWRNWQKTLATLGAAFALVAGLVFALAR